jgi:hypothetical protein
LLRTSNAQCTVRDIVIVVVIVAAAAVAVASEIDDTDDADAVAAAVYPRARSPRVNTLPVRCRSENPMRD